MTSLDTCFDSAILHLESLERENLGCYDVGYQIRCLRTFHLFARRWGNDYVDDYENDAISLGALSVEIEDAVSTIAQDFHTYCVYVDYEDAISLGAHSVEIKDAVSTIAQDFRTLYAETWGNDYVDDGSSFSFDYFLVLRNRAKANVVSFEEKIKRWYIKFSDCSRHSTSSCSSAHLVEFIDSILGILDYCCKNYDWNYQIGLCLQDLRMIEALDEELTFLKNFIHLFTTLGAGGSYDDDAHLGQNLLTHIKAVAVVAAYHSYMLQFGSNIDDELGSDATDEMTEMEAEISKKQHDEMKSKISELLQKIKPVDPQVSQIYIPSLNGLKLSTRQPFSVVTLEILQDFITSLLSYHFEILNAGKIPAFSNKHQLQIFHRGLRTLRAILKKQPRNFDEEMQDLTKDMVCDAGVVVFSLFRDAAIEVGFAQEMDRLLSDLLERIKLIRVKVAGMSPEEEEESLFNFPMVDELGFFDFLLENLMELTSCEKEAAVSAAIPKHQIQTIYKELVFLRSFLGKIVQLRHEKEELQVLWNRVVELAYRIEFLIDSSMIGDVPEESYSQTSFDSITQEINILKLDTQKIFDKEDLGVFDKEDLDVTKTSNDLLPLEKSVPIIKDEIICLDDEATSIMNRLKSPTKELQVVPIVGMPGLGKTTLAKLVYNDFSIMQYFRIRAWCCISQVYDQKNLLLRILTCISSGLYSECEEDLAQLLRQNLLKKKYLIVLDDIWDIDAWNILKNSFPDDKNGSRIILTSRFQDVVPEEKFNGKPHFLRHLSDDESWKLLKSKLFPTCDWPLALRELGTQIVKSCKGLPLTIVILAGILSLSEQGDWRDVVGHCLSLSYDTILDQCNMILELSYRYLPDKLKSCFLYFGGFPEDQELSVSELTLLWIAEGFVRKEQSKSLEDEAKDYLIHLISKSLVMVDERSSIGEVKTCRIHDLLHSFCVKKAKTENFFRSLKGYEEVYNFDETHNVRRLWIYFEGEHYFKKLSLVCPQLRSMFMVGYHQSFGEPNLLSNMNLSKLLRVLTMRQINLGDFFPDELTLMVHLRYLAVEGGQFRSIPSSIGNLSSLETLIVNRGYEIKLPIGFWKLKKLRHLKGKKSLFNFDSEHLGNSVELPNLETFSTLKIYHRRESRDWEMVLKKFPNIRKLRVFLVDGSHDDAIWPNKVMVLRVGETRSFSLFCSDKFVHGIKLDLSFPLNLRKLNLGNLRLPWCKVSAIGKLPNLEVLKLNRNAFKGEIWDMEEAEQFPKLKCLKLSYLDIVRWTTSNSGQDFFPCLVKLVFEWCTRLEEVPSCLGDIPNLQKIEVCNCSEAASSSIMQIYEDQADMGNEDLKVTIYHSDSDTDYDSSD